jgi:hypothetical protein
MRKNHKPEKSNEIQNYDHEQAIHKVTYRLHSDGEENVSFSDESKVKIKLI